MKLQKPEFVHMNGKLRRWDEATLHVGCEAAIRGLNVFEGVKAYRQPDGSLAIVMLRHHFERLQHSARLLYIPFEQSFEEFTNSLRELCEKLEQPDKEMWLRTTLFVTQGNWGQDTGAELVITGYQAEMEPPHSIKLGVSSWRRSPDVSLPARVKAGPNYQVARLARIEGRAQGCDDMVLLNQSGRVAEATGSAILMVRDGRVYTPPATEAALESITIRAIESLAHSLRIPFERRPIDRTELVIADELAICGTLAEVVPVKMFEGRELPSKSTLLAKLQARYYDAVRGLAPHPDVDLTPVTRARVMARPEPNGRAMPAEVR